MSMIQKVLVLPRGLRRGATAGRGDVAARAHGARARGGVLLRLLGLYFLPQRRLRPHARGLRPPGRPRGEATGLGGGGAEG